MTNPHQPENHEPINWGSLENDFAGTEQREEIIQNGELALTGRDILNALPSDLVALFEVAETEPRELEIGVDGNPVVTNLREARAVMEERPEIAEVVKKAVNEETIVKRQQLDINHEAAEKAGNQEAIDKVEEEKAKLHNETERLEFWSTVAALHPIDPKFVREQTNYVGYTGVTGNARMCMQIQEKIGRHIDYLREHGGLRQLDHDRAYYEKEQMDELERKHTNTWLSARERSIEEAHLEINKYTKILDDIVAGNTYPDGNPLLTAKLKEEDLQSKAKREKLGSPNEYYELIRTLPGKDPVVEILNGRLKELPRQGWIIEASINPGHLYSGVEVMRFEDGGFEATGSNGRLEDSEARIEYRTQAKKAGSYTLSYLPVKHRDDQSRHDGMTDGRPKSIVDLDESRIIKGIDQPLRAFPNDIAMDSLRSSNLDYIIEHYEQSGIARKVETVRMTDDPTEAKKIIAQLAKAMGMNIAEAGKFVEALDKKDVFSDLKVESTTERREREYKEEKQSEEVVQDYGDGSRLIQNARGDLIMYEADGSSWLRQSANGLMYSGPDDMIGHYPE